MDDSGSMQCQTDVKDKKTGRMLSRWVEAKHALKEMIEILAHVPTPSMAIVFLNRKNVINFQHKGESPERFVEEAYRQVRSFSVSL